VTPDAPDKLTPAELVDAVDHWLSEHAGARRNAAFAEFAERTGRSQSGVSQSYYAAKRRTRGVGSSTRSKTRSSANGQARLSAKPSTAIRALTEYIEGLEREVKELRDFRASVLAMLGDA
jgi:hypothetical protein